jgi:hypothetical protein
MWTQCFDESCQDDSLTIGKNTVKKLLKGHSVQSQTYGETFSKLSRIYSCK